MAKSRPAPSSLDKAVSWPYPVLVFLATFLSFWPAIGGGFVNWDDPTNFLNNAGYRVAGWSLIKWSFVSSLGHLGNYEPLSWVLSGLTYAFWGMNPKGFHLNAVVLHSFSAVLFYFVARRLLDADEDEAARRDGVSVPAAAFAALLFSLHPLRVEAVAWVSAQHYTLAGVFFMTAILCYLKAVDDSRTAARRLWLTTAAIGYGFSLLSFSAGMILPAALLVVDVYPLRRLDPRPWRWLRSSERSVLLEKLPFLLLALGSAALAVRIRAGQEAIFSGGQGMGVRFGQACYGIIFYLVKTAVPTGLSPLYELPMHIEELTPVFWLAGALVLGITAALCRWRRRWPAGLAAWVYYLAALFPVLGFAQYGRQIAADRYTYLPCLAWPLIVAGCWARVWRDAPARPQRLRTASLALVVVGVLGIMTWRQTKVWGSSESLWTRAVEVDPNSRVAQNSLGVSLLSEGKRREAIPHYLEALRLDPQYGYAHNDLGSALRGEGRIDEAIPHFQEAIRLAPNNYLAYMNLGLALEDKGRNKEAAESFRAALKINPGFEDARRELEAVSKKARMQ